MRPLLSLLATLLLTASAFSQDVLHARIVGITDGDTVRALSPDNQLLRVRLRNIDAPEKGQAFGSAAKENLSRYIWNRDVALHISGIDRYGRVLAVIMVAGADINLRMVSDGYAWVYEKYIGENPPDVQARYREAEAAARAARIGLWQDKEPIAPWLYRQTEREQRALLQTN